MADIQLSAQLFKDIQQAVEKLQPNADNGVILQYLAAVTGYLLGSERNMGKAEKEDYFKELCGFAQHVFDDMQSRQDQQAAAAQSAFGYWTPPK